MIGGLLKSASRAALLAAVGLMAGGVAAQAADLGGNCCADLEERVAELEATTARKGNRKVSLTVYGQVNWAIMHWDDGFERNTYVLDNNNSRTRFGFRGEAKIDADWSAGYLLEIGVLRNNSSLVTQDDPRVASGLDVRHSALYLDSKRLGRVWLGHTSSATDGITEINLGATAATGVDRSVYLGNFSANTGFGLTWNNLAGRGDGNWQGDDGRRDIVRYVSPTMAGFTASAAWGGDDYWDVALRYAGEFNSIRVAAGVGYGKATGNDDAIWGGGSTTGLAGCVANGSGSIDCEHIGVSGSIMHVPTGLFLSGSYSQVTDNNVPSGYDDTDDAWYITAGIQRKWNSLGATTIYGEYGDYNKGAFQRITTSGGVTTTDTFTGSNVKMWTIGINQTIDAAAMDLYLFYSRYSGDATLYDSCDFDGQSTTCYGGGKSSAEDLQMVVGGAIIRF